MKTLEELEKENHELRTMLAFAHCGGSPQLYHDDGELQDTRMDPFIDWRRDSVEEIQLKLTQRFVQTPEYKEMLATGLIKTAKTP